jgi:hypothetical protein
LHACKAAQHQLEFCPEACVQRVLRAAGYVLDRGGGHISVDAIRVYGYQCDVGNLEGLLDDAVTISRAQSDKWLLLNIQLYKYVEQLLLEVRVVDILIKTFGNKGGIVVNSHISNVEQLAAELRERSLFGSAAVVARLVAFFRAVTLSLPVAIIVVSPSVGHVCVWVSVVNTLRAAWTGSLSSMFGSKFTLAPTAASAVM